MMTISEINSLHPVSNEVQSLTRSDDDKYINILLTRYPDKTSKLMQLIGCCFTHASIGMGDSTGIFYSLSIMTPMEFHQHFALAA